jgi:hypothetical protein
MEYLGMGGPPVASVAIRILFRSFIEGLVAETTEFLSSVDEHVVRKDGGAKALTNTSGDPSTDDEARQLLHRFQQRRQFVAASSFGRSCMNENMVKRVLRFRQGEWALQILGKIIEWCDKNEEVLKTRKFQTSMDFRVLAFDRERRPVLYLCGANQILREHDCAGQLTVMMLKAVEMRPPGVEHVRIFLDVHGVSLSMNMNPMGILKCAEVLINYFFDKIQDVTFIDFPSSLLFVKNSLWSHLGEEGKKRLRFVSVAEAYSSLEADLPQEDAVRVLATMKQNRDPDLTFQERRRTWTTVDFEGKVVPADL